jgi:GNAT superfamily N-acetyltransferase
MSSITIQKVETKKQLRSFVDFHYALYKDNPYDVPNLFMDEMNTLTPSKNPAFEFCDAEYYLAYDENGKIVGRVAAIINNKANKKWDRKSVRFGWIDFVDDINVSRALLDAVADYGRSKGMTEIVGPLGFTDMDPEGMLIWGFDKLGTMPTIYNYDYYPRHIEQLGGWEKDTDYVEYYMRVPEKVPEKYSRIAEMVEQRYHLRVRKLTMKDVRAGYGYKVFDLINDTYKDLYGFSELSQKQIDQYVKEYLPMLDLSLVTCIEDASADNKLVGIGITMPSMSRAMQKTRRGRLFPFGWWHLLRAVKFHKTEGVDLLLLGILPEYRSKGANALLFADLIPRYIDYGFKWGESQVEMENNENVQRQWGALNPENHKRRRCYKKQL